MSKVEDYINKQRALLLNRQQGLIEKYPVRYYFDLLFDLATIFEEFYVDNHGKQGLLQDGSQVLANLILTILQKKEFAKDKREVEKAQNKWLWKIQKQASKDGRQNNVLSELLKTALALSELNDYEDLEKNDPSRKLSLQDDELKVEIVRPLLLAAEKKTQQKYAFEIAYYLNFGKLIAPFKDKHLFLFQIKITSPKSHAQLYKSHLKDALTIAYRQNRKVYKYLSENWIKFRHKLNADINWNELQAHLIVLSSSFEADRSPKIKESIKISQFELERYLKNDAYLLFDEETEEVPTTLKQPFYERSKISGDRLWELIDSDALWSFLNEKK